MKIEGSVKEMKWNRSRNSIISIIKSVFSRGKSAKFVDLCLEDLIKQYDKGSCGWKNEYTNIEK